ncbi:TetR/AcrR family transcriptional regulator [Streptomyces sp. NPDC059866]|uniref:TetR/AcrR family transcriptional regulator n=1 Tax=Streptomyces sp. NPDC059866 TaxID=3346978 RepID=UPI00364D5097
MQVMPEKGAAGGGLREQKKRATRAALAEAAVRLAAEHGVENVTVEAISAAAGVSVRTFFNYFDARDDAFVVIDTDISARVRSTVLHAPAEVPPLDAVRDAIAAELAEAEQQHELWQLHAEVLRAAPHLLVRSLGAHLADETGLAVAIARRLRGGPADVPGTTATDEDARRSLDLYPRLLAAVAGTAVRVAVEHWSADPAERQFADVFQETFASLAAGLPAPPG